MGRVFECFAASGIHFQTRNPRGSTARGQHPRQESQGSRTVSSAMLQKQEVEGPWLLGLGSPGIGADTGASRLHGGKEQPPWQGQGASPSPVGRESLCDERGQVLPLTAAPQALDGVQKAESLHRMRHCFRQIEPRQVRKPRRQEDNATDHPLPTLGFCLIGGRDTGSTWKTFVKHKPSRAAQPFLRVLVHPLSPSCISRCPDNPAGEFTTRQLHYYTHRHFMLLVSSVLNLRERNIFFDPVSLITRECQSSWL